MESIEDKKRRRTRFLETGFLGGKHILDVGTGPLALIAAKGFGCKVTSIDIDDGKLAEYKKQAEEEGLDEIEFLHEDALNMGFPDQSFEVVACYGSLHHIAPEKRERFLSEVWRVAEKKLVLAELNPELFEEIHPKEDYPKIDAKLSYSNRANIFSISKTFLSLELFHH